MSSHHVVRDAQEPALIIANGEACSWSLLQQAMDWSPMVMVLDGALDRVIELGIQYHVVLGDFDHQTIEDIRNKSNPDTQIIHTPDQNLSDLEKGIEWLIAKGFKAVNIVWATGHRSDHYLNNIGILARYQHQINVVMLDDYSKIYPIKSGFKKHFEQGQNISLIPLNKVQGLSSTNLVWSLSNATLEYPYSTSSSNKVASTGIVEVQFSSGDLLLIESMTN